MLSLFSFLKTSSSPRSRQPRPSVRPRLESLEDRCLLSGGVLDPTFGSSGIVTTSVGTLGTASAEALAIYPNAGTANDGKIVAAGASDVMKGKGNATNEFAVVRYNANGSLDSSFGGTGQVITSIGSGPSVAWGVGIQGDGKVVAAGGANSEFAVVRYNTNGSLDTSFGSSAKGIVLTNITKGSTDQALDMAIQPDGKIVAGGITNPTKSTTENVALVRYNPDGSLDTSFGSGGKVTTHFASPVDGGLTFDMALYPNSSAAEAGKIVVVERLDNAASDTIVVIRYNPNGTLDTSFGNGIGYVTLNNVSSTLPSVALQSDDRIVVASQNSTGQIELVRYNPDGSLDPAFGTGGIAISALPGTQLPRDVTIQQNGQIVVAGTQLNVNGQNFLVARYNSNGSLDTTFGTGGVVTVTAVTVANNRVSAALEADGRIVLAGTATVPGNPSGGNSLEFALARFVAYGPEVGSFTANPNPVTVGSSLTLTASNITDEIPSAAITQVAFYVQINGSNTLLGYGTQSSSGVWTLTFRVNLTPGTYTLFTQAEDGYGILGDLASLTLTVE